MPRYYGTAKVRTHEQSSLSYAVCLRDLLCEFLARLPQSYCDMSRVERARYVTLKGYLRELYKAYLIIGAHDDLELERWLAFDEELGDGQEIPG